jgi:hypothetical protein
MNRLQKPVAEINPASQVMWLQSMNYSHFVWLKFKQLCHFGCQSLVQGEPSPYSSSFSLVSTQWFLAGFFDQK